MEELISVIVPVYNVKNYLTTCVKSIVAQSYGNLEIILVDDGSTDGSGNICDELVNFDKRIKVVHKVNGGLSDARNYGMKKSHGDFYAFIDSDDALHKDFFMELMNAQHKYNADIVACDMTLFSRYEELPQLYAMRHDIKAKLFIRDDALKEYFVPAEERIIHHGLCMKIYRRSLFDGLQFFKGKLHEDLYITYKLLDIANRTVYVDCPYYFYFQSNTSSICKNYGVKNFLDEAEAYRTIYTYFTKKNRITNELIHFLIVQYLLMLEKGYAIRNAAEIRSTRKSVVKWVDDNIKNCNHYGRIKRNIIRIGLRDIRIYSWLKKLRGR